jgi:hypothetical protein
MNKRTVSALALAAMLGFGGMGSSAYAAPVVFTANLGNFENPPTGSLGTGFASVTMDVVAHTLLIDVSFAGLTGLTTVAHIHCCTAPPGNIGVATTTPTLPGFPAGVTSGAYLTLFNTTLAGTYNAAFITGSPGGTVAAAETRLFAGLQAGQAYFNIHTTTSGGGEIRGFLQPVPEPSTLALAGAGLALVALIRRGRSA